MTRDTELENARTERRLRDRRGSGDRRNRTRMGSDRRQGFGRRKEDLDEAGTLERELWEALRQAEGSSADDLRVAVALNDLAMFYYRAERYTDGEPLHKRALEIQEKILGPTHPDVIQTLHNLAALYYAQENYAESEVLLKRALNILHQALGKTGTA